MESNRSSDPNFSASYQEYKNPLNVQNSIFYLIGFIVLVLNKIRNELRGYRSARGFSSNLFERAVANDLAIVTRWSGYLKKYKDTNNSIFKGKEILELGPGADLGVGLFLLAEKAKSYTAFDIVNLVKSAPPAIYDYLYEYLKKSGADHKTIDELKSQLQLAQGKHSEKLNFQYSKDFDLSIFPKNNFDLVVSNSAFQQFTDPVKTISQLSKIVKSGCQFVALIDLKTHSGLLRTRDPLNIYRYPDSIYLPLKFLGSPNRMRPYEYEKALKFHGWTDIKIFPRQLLNSDYLLQVNHTLNRKFRDEVNQMQYLTVVICATKI